MNVQIQRGVTWVSTLVIAASFVSSARAQALPAMKTVTVASGLTQPVFVTALPGDYNRLFIVQQNGQIKILNLQTGALNASPFLTVTGLAGGSEQGLLGLTFDPDYATNRKFYVHLVANVGAGQIQVLQFQTLASNADLADMQAGFKTLLSFNHPAANHNAGWIGFSPRPGDDHNLYISSGDGGDGNDKDSGSDPGGHHEPGGNAQWDQTLLGKMLRIHVDPNTGTYTIPPDNPFAGATNPAVKKEIWLLGLRNPYRDSFDRGTGRMFLGDVGQSTREEVDVQQPTNPGGGENYGWRDREGLIQNPAYPTAPPTPTPNPPRVDPILDYPRSGATISGRTVVGGYVYRGKQIPGLRGTYVFGDYLGPTGGTAKIFTLNYDGLVASNTQNITTQLFPTTTGANLANPSSFGEDANGELYITDIGNGNLYRVMPITPNVMIDGIAKSGTSVILHGIGAPFTKVTLQVAPDPNATSFLFLATLDVAADGTFQYTDTTTLSTRFYRATYP